MDASKPNEAADSEPAHEDVASQSLSVSERHWSWPARLGFLVAGVLVPIVCFAANPDGIPILRRWQSGKLNMYTALLLGWVPSSVFFPFLLYSMASLSLLVFRPARFSQYFLVRLGIYTGVLLAIQYLVIVVSHVMSIQWWFFALLIVAIPWGLGGMIHRVARRFGQKRVWLITCAIILSGLVSWGIVSFLTGTPLEDIVTAAVAGPYLICLFFGTPWALTAYSVMALVLMRTRRNGRLQVSLLQFLTVFSWFAAYFGAWRTSINLMLIEYAKLPPEQPGGCYICTAAAKGHRRVVRSVAVVYDDGRVLMVNEQMRCLKCAELILKHSAPLLHRGCRAVYDRVGPSLAAAMPHPLLADAAYLALKPAEWLARLVLAILLPDHVAITRTIYSPAQGSNSGPLT